MRGKHKSQTDLLTLINLEYRIPSKHPIRRIKQMVNEVLRRLDDEFESMYNVQGRPSIPPERLLKSKVLMALYTVRSDRQFCERLNYDLLFQWFLDMNPNERGLHAISFSKNMERLLEHHISGPGAASAVHSAVIEPNKEYTYWISGSETHSHPIVPDSRMQA